MRGYIMNSSSPSPGQRLALAIVSLALWVVVFLIVVLSLITTPSTIFVTSVTSTTAYNNQAMHILYPLLIAGLLIFSVLIFGLSVLFSCDNYNRQPDEQRCTDSHETSQRGAAS